MQEWCYAEEGLEPGAPAKLGPQQKTDERDQTTVPDTSTKNSALDVGPEVKKLHNNLEH